MNLHKLLFFTPFFYLIFLIANLDMAMTQDLGRHLVLGREIVECGCVPGKNLFSYVMGENSFVNHHWLSEVIFFKVFEVGSFNALLVLKTILLLSSFGVVYWMSRSHRYFLTFFSIPFVYLFSYRFDTRPELFSFVIFSVFLYLADRYRKDKKLLNLYPLILLQAVWVNLHIYFVMGIVVIGFLLLEEIVIRRRYSNLVFVFFALLIASFVSPNFIEGALSPFFIFKDYGYSIVENQNVFFLNLWIESGHILVFELLSVVLLIMIPFADLRRNFFWVCIVLFTMLASFVMVRNIPLFVLASVPFFPFLAERIWKKLHMSVSVKRALWSLLVLCILVVISIQVVRRFQSNSVGFFYFENMKNASEHIVQAGYKGQMFNNFDTGSYLIYKLYPQYKVFVDGRPEAYSKEFFDEYKLMQEDDEFFYEQVERYDIEFVVFSTTDITPWARTFLNRIKSDENWKTDFIDSYSIVLSRGFE